MKTRRLALTVSWPTNSSNVRGLRLSSKRMSSFVRMGLRIAGIGFLYVILINKGGKATAKIERKSDCPRRGQSLLI
jgi:hypothetical protein